MRTDRKRNSELYDIVTIRMPKGSISETLKAIKQAEREKYDDAVTVNDLGERALREFIAGWKRDNGGALPTIKLRTHG